MKKHLKPTLISVFLGIVTLSSLVMAGPMMPALPSSDAAFASILKYFHMENGIGPVEALSVQVEEFPQYTLKTVELKGQASFPPVHLKLKIPKEARGSLPALVFFAGFQTGDEVLKIIPTPKDSIYVGFQYPMPIDLKEGLPLFEFQKIEFISAMMAGAMKWLFEQPEIDHQRVNVVAVSFGTLFYPLAQRILSENSYQPRTITLGYGGADIPELLGPVLKGKMGEKEIGLTKLVVRYGTWFVDPLFHLSHLRGPFLIVRGADDEVFPAQTHNSLLSQLPDPKTVVTLPGPHILPDRADLVGPFLKTVQNFIIENKGI